MMHVTWEEIINGCDKYVDSEILPDYKYIIIKLTKNLLNLLDKNNYLVQGNKLINLYNIDELVAFIYTDKVVGIALTRTRLKIYTLKESDIVSEGFKCCSSPNIITNYVLDKPFKVCRNCKLEIK